MAFTLTDPRMQAISQAAGNFGTGMGNAINQYVNNQIFANALQQAQGQDPLAMMQTMARSNVDPRSFELAMSPQVMQRMQGVNLANMIQEAANNLKSGKGTIQELYTAALKGMVQSGDMSGVSALLNSYAKNLRANESSINYPEDPIQQKTEGPNGVQSPRGNAQETQEPAPAPKAGFSTKGLMGEDFSKQQAPIIPGIKITGRRPSPEQQIPYAPVTQLPSAKEMEKLKGQFIRSYGPEVGEQAFNDHITFLEKQRSQDIQNLQLSQAERKEQMQLNKDDREAVNAFWEKNYGTRGLGDEVKLAGIDYALKLKTGTLEERLLKTQSDFWNPIEMSLQTLDKNLPSAPIFSSLNSNEKMEYLNDIHPIVNQAIEKAPEGAKQYIYDMARKKLRQRRGIGPVSAEYAIFKPEQELIDEYNQLPKPVPEYMHGTYESEAAQKQQNARRKKLTKMLPKIIKKTVGRGMSPLISHNLVVAAGWSDEDWVKAYTEAKDSGLKIESRFQMADKDAYRPQKPSLKERIFGNPLLELTEIYQ